MSRYKNIKAAALFHCFGDKDKAFELVGDLLAGILSGGDSFMKAAKASHEILNEFIDLPSDNTLYCLNDVVVHPLTQIDDEERVCGFVDAMGKLEQDRIDVDFAESSNPLKVELALAHLRFLMESDQLMEEHWPLIRELHYGLSIELDNAKKNYVRSC